MLQSLHIENVAVVKTIDIELSDGLTALTGETGAGKSIIIDSLNLLLGARADKELIRNGENRAEVSALFCNIDDETCKSFEDIGFELPDKSVMLSRTLTRTSSGARINGRAVTLQLLREASQMLFGIHGQNDNMRLLDPKNHIDILDSFANCRALREKYKVLYLQMLHLQAEIDSISKDVRERERLGEMLRYQISEIDSCKLREGEEEALEALASKLRHAERINKCCALVQKALEGGKGMGAIYLADRAAGALDSISDAVPEAEALSDRLEHIKYELEDIAATAATFSDFDDGDPSSKLDRVEGRLDAIAKLKRKYGNSVEEILEFRNEAAEKLSRIDNADDRKEDLQNDLKNLSTSAKSIAKELSSKRRKAAYGLSQSVTETLSFLDMPKVTFEVMIRSTDHFMADGIDEIEFLICTNPGEPLLPMAKIASGGELARIMLALKNVLNLSDGINTVIFDEIDTGISGKTSRKVGIKLKEIGRSAQVICVTHSAQIASLANTHLFVSKKEVAGRTESFIDSLDGEKRVLEIARILGGIELTERQIEAAREMIAEGTTY